MNPNPLELLKNFTVPLLMIKNLNYKANVRFYYDCA